MTISMRDEATRAELSRQVAVLLVENDALRTAARKLARVDERWEAEVAVRIRCQRRLHVAALVLHEIERAYPHTRSMIDSAREDIWDG